MIIEYSKIDSKRIKIMRITSKDGKNVDSFGYMSSSVNLSNGEIISQKGFNSKIDRIRKCEKIAFGEIKGKVRVVRYRSDRK